MTLSLSCHPLRLITLLVLATFLWATIVAAQPPVPFDQAQPSDEVLITRITHETGDTPEVYRHAETGAVRFLSIDSSHVLAAPAGFATASPEIASRAFLATYGQMFGLSDQSQELTLMRQENVQQRSFVHFQQTHLGVPVIGGELIVQTDQQRALISISGELLPRLTLSVQPQVDGVTAEQIALGSVAKSYAVAAGALRIQQPVLWIFNPALLGGPGPRISRLVWRTEVQGDSTLAIPIRELVLVDAQTSGIALTFNQIAEIRRRVVCNDNNVIDPDDNERNNCTANTYVRVEGQEATGVADVDDAYDYAGDAYDYFYNTFGRDSLDDQGMPLVSLVKYCPSADTCPYPNAFWNGQQMTYGDGFASSDDVVAHELVHGLTDFTSRLFYYYQSGAINESLSDIFGELIDLTNSRGNDSAQMRWLIGEDLPSSFGVIRNMQDPTSLPTGISGPNFSPSPDRIMSPYYVTDENDRGGVHTNSGVNNKAAFLMVDGGTFNGQTIRGIGLTKVGAIYYTLQVALLTSASDYQDLSTNLPAACSSLASSGAFDLTTADCVQVQRAVKATEMDLLPQTMMTDAPVCAASERPTDVFYDDFEYPADGRWISAALVGQNTWFYPALNNPFNVDFTYATSGVGNLWGYDIGGTQNQPERPSDMVIAMTGDVIIPARARMHFRHAFDFDSDIFHTYDGGVIEYSTNTGLSWQDAGSLFSENGYNGIITNQSDNPLGGRNSFVQTSQGYSASRLDLSSLAGKSVRFRFRIGTDSLVSDFGWFIDDLRIYTCSENLPTASWTGTNQTVSEGAGRVLLVVGLSAPVTSEVRLTIAASGTAVVGTDYALSPTLVIIPAGSLTATVTVQLLDNHTWAPDRILTLTLTSPHNATVADGIRTITITDNDSPLPTASWTGTNQTVSEGAGRVLLVVGLSTPVTSEVRLTIAASGTAVVGTDYALSPTLVIIPAGSLTATVTVQLFDNHTWAPDRILTLTLTSPHNATVADGIRTITITDNDPQGYRVNLPLITIPSPKMTANESGFCDTVGV